MLRGEGEIRHCFVLCASFLTWELKDSVTNRSGIRTQQRLQISLVLCFFFTQRCLLHFGEDLTDWLFVHGKSLHEEDDHGL